MPDIICPNCKATVAAGRFCSSCAGSLDAQPVESRPIKQGWQPPAQASPPPLPRFKIPDFVIVVGVLATVLIVILLLRSILGIGVDSGKPNQTSAPPSTSQPATPPPQATVSDAPMHLAEAKKSLAYNYHPTGDNKTWGRLDEASDHLALIPREAKEYADAQKLLKEVARRQAEMDAWSKIAARETYANTLEREYLKKGMDVDISLSGADKTTIRFKYVLMSRPMVYQMMTDAEVTNTLRSVGFKKIIFTDGYYQTWNQDL